MICSRKGYRAQGRHARQRHARAHAAAADVRRRDRLLARATRAPTARSRWRWRWPEPDASYYMPYQYGNQANPRAHYNGTAPEILEELDEISRVRGRPRHRRHADGQRPPPARGARRRGEDRRRRADAGRARAGPALARRRLHPADHRPLAAGPEDLRHQPRRDRVDAQAARRGGHLRGRLARARSPRSPCGSPTSWTRATSSSSSATTAGSTSPPGIYTRPVEEIENLDSTVWW